MALQLQAARKIFCVIIPIGRGLHWLQHTGDNSKEPDKNSSCLFSIMRRTVCSCFDFINEMTFCVVYQTRIKANPTQNCNTGELKVTSGVWLTQDRTQEKSVFQNVCQKTLIIYLHELTLCSLFVFFLSIFVLYRFFFCGYILPPSIIFILTERIQVQCIFSLSQFLQI